MRYGKAAVWLLTGILAEMSPTVQTVDAAAQSKPPASSAPQGSDGKMKRRGKPPWLQARRSVLCMGR